MTTIDTTARPTGFVRDTAAVFVRESRPLVRDPFSVIFSLVQPLVFLGLFGPLLIGAAGGDVAGTLQWFVPGILVMVALFGTASTGANLLFEMQTGSHERTLVAPLSRSALLVGRALKEVVPLTIQGTIVVLVAVPFGFSARRARPRRRPRGARRVRHRVRLPELHARARVPQPRLDVLDGAPDAAVPADDPLGHAAAARGRPRVDEGRRRGEPAELPRRRRARAARGRLRGTRGRRRSDRGVRRARSACSSACARCAAPADLLRPACTPSSRPVDAVRCGASRNTPERRAGLRRVGRT